MFCLSEHLPAYCHDRKNAKNAVLTKMLRLLRILHRHYVYCVTAAQQMVHGNCSSKTAVGPTPPTVRGDATAATQDGPKIVLKRPKTRRLN